VVKVYPLYFGDPADEENYELHCQAKVLLHHPFKNFEDIQQGFPTFKETWQYCTTHCPHPNPHDPLPVPADAEENLEDDSEDDSVHDEEEDNYIAPWMHEAARCPGASIQLDLS
jgi:hypothetical protein